MATIVQLTDTVHAVSAATSEKKKKGIEFMLAIIMGITLFHLVLFVFALVGLRDEVKSLAECVEETRQHALHTRACASSIYSNLLALKEDVDRALLRLPRTRSRKSSEEAQ